MYLARIFQEVLGWESSDFPDFLYDANILFWLLKSQNLHCEVFSICLILYL